MKRFAALVLALGLCLALPAAFAEVSYSDFAGVYEFCSGVGAWNTELTLNADGTFRGYFSDSDMGASELEGTGCDAIVYYCDFTGRLSPLTQISEWEYLATVDALDEGAPDGETYIEDNLLYYASHAYGVALGAQLRLYLPGTPKTMLPAGFLDWLSCRGMDIEWEELPDAGLYNITNDCGFVWGGRPAEEPALPELTPAPEQPWSWLEPEAEATAPDAPQELRFPIDGVVVNVRTFVSLRESPSTNAVELARAPLGATVTLYSSDAWYDGKHWFVEAGYQGLRGYMCIEYLDAVLPDGLAAWMNGRPEISGEVRAANAGTDLILRAGPGAGYDSLGMLYGGEALGWLGDGRLDGKGVCWYRCSHYGRECWVSAKHTVLRADGGAVYSGARGIF